MKFFQAEKTEKLSNIIKNRRSIRKYSSKAVSREQIEAIIEAAVLAPSAKNRQPWKYIVYTGESKTELGLGTLWIANTCFAYEDMMRFIASPGQLIGAVAVGYADESPNPRPRKDMKEVLEYR